MAKIANTLARYLIISLFCFALIVPAFGQQQAPSTPATAEAQPSESGPEKPKEEGTPYAKVVVEGRPVLTVYDPVMSGTPQERALGIEKRIIYAAQSGMSINAIQVRSHPGWAEINIGSQTLMAVTDIDAKAAGKPREALAAENAKSLGEAIVLYRQGHSWRMFLRGLGKTALTTLVLIAVLWLARRLRLATRTRLERKIAASSAQPRKSAFTISIAYLGPIALALGTLLRWLLILGLLQAYLTITLGYFSYTREISQTVTKWVFSQLATMGQSALDYLPNLLVVAVIVLITYYAIRLVRLVFSEIARGNLEVRGFFPDWAEPTEKLVRILVFVLAVIVAFPYLPGAKSPAFQGISIFLGVLLSLGSSSAVANAIAGIILTYMRSFLVGDWVQIGDVTGEVTERSLLVTRVLTPKDEVITIPNSTVMSGAVRNYSVEARKSGVIFHTTATIGYDAPWRTVHQLMIDAALATNHVRKQPPPFVLQTALNDFYVAYELNAYTDSPRLMLAIYSELHQNIQDKFNEAGVEICSPHFSSLRDGNTIAIPNEYIKPEYKTPGFRVNTDPEK